MTCGRPDSSSQGETLACRSLWPSGGAASTVRPVSASSHTEPEPNASAPSGLTRAYLAAVRTRGPRGSGASRDRATAEAEATRAAPSSGRVSMRRASLIGRLPCRIGLTAGGGAGRTHRAGLPDRPVAARTFRPPAVSAGAQAK